MNVRPTIGASLGVPLALGAALAVAVLSCDPQAPDYGLDAVKDLTTPPDDPNLGCGLVLPADSTFDQRAQCAFKSGERPLATLGIDRATVARIPIRHVIVMLNENRSFDHLLGKINVRGQPDADVYPLGFSNKDLQGNVVTPFDPGTTCIAHDPGHQHLEMREGIADGGMSGFVTSAARTTNTDGHFALSSYDEAQLPFSYFLAKTFALSDRHFQSIASGTAANRTFMLLGDVAGNLDTGIVYPPPDRANILQVLTAAKVSWGAYTDGMPFDGTLGMDHNSPGIYKLQDFLDALDKGTLPSVVFLDARGEIDDDHPDADLQKGEAWRRNVYEHAIASPQWQHLAIFWTYDEGGGFFDHVPPPAACKPTADSTWDRLGVRVPMVAISPWAKRNYVSHVVSDHTALLRFMALLFDLPALTARDANANALLDLFDFSCGRNDPPLAVAPPAGTGGCANPP